MWDGKIKNEQPETGHWEIHEWVKRRMARIVDADPELLNSTEQTILHAYANLNTRRY